MPIVLADDEEEVLLERCQTCLEYVDPDELVSCHSCGDSVCHNRSLCGISGDGYCESCDDERADCQNCGHRGWRDDLSYCDSCCEYYCCGMSGCDEYHCSDCCDCCEDDSDYYDERGAIRYASYRPELVFKGDRSQTMMGVELEVGGNQSSIVPVVHSIDPSEDHLYMKEDGSISGVEIVTHPMTLEYARQYPFQPMLAGLRSAGCRVSSGYGLHIHVARDAFRKNGARRGRKQESDVHQMLWLLFMYRNSTQLEKLARRVSDSWGSFRKPAPGELKNKAKGDRGRERYVAVNCLNSNTFELRFFKSTLWKSQFYAALEFADASVKYTRNLSSADVLKGAALSWDVFTQWAADNDYPMLHAEILKRCVDD
jgi:hypothetical protein